MMQPFKQMAGLAQLMSLRDSRRNQVFHLNRIQTGPLNRDNILTGHDPDIRDQGGSGKTPTVAKGGDVHQEVDIKYIFTGKMFQDLISAQGHPGLEILIPVSVHSNCAAGADFHAMLAKGAMVVKDFILAFIVETIGLMVAVIDA